MAVKLEDKTNTLPVSATFPYGNIIDDTGAANGTPVDKSVYADFHQFFARLLDLASNPSIVINDLPDNAVNGFQYYEALLATKTNLGLQNESKMQYLHGNYNELVPSENFGGAPIVAILDIIVDGTKCYILDNSQDKVFVFDILTDTHLIAEDIDISGETNSAEYTFIYNSKIYVSSNTDKNVYVYNLATSANIPGETIDTSLMNRSRGFFITAADKMYIADNLGDFIFVYDITTGLSIGAEKITTTSNPFDVYVVGNRIYAGTSGGGVKVYSIVDQTFIFTFGASDFVNGFRIKVVGQKVYVGVAGNGIEVFDMNSGAYLYDETIKLYSTVQQFDIKNNRVYAPVAGSLISVGKSNIVTTYL